MSTRFWAPDARAPGELVNLPADEAQHLRQVLRLGPGAAIRVFDGRGHEFAAVVEHADRARVAVRVGDPQPSAPEARTSVTLALAVLKGDKMDDVVRDMVMLGVAAIQPLFTDRSETSPAALERGRRVDRWQRIAVSSAKQCGRAVVPPVLPPLTFQALIAAIAALQAPNPAFMLVEPAAHDGAGLDALEKVAPLETTVLIGPEGGWTPQEIAHGASACRLLTLGRRTLRADAMPIVALSALFALWREF